MDYLNPENQICRMSASELASRIKDRELSAREVTEAYIQRIEAVNPDLNAVVIPLFEDARLAADAADNNKKREKNSGPLSGVPMTIKEQYIVSGTQTTLGATHQIGKTYSTEGPLVTALREAGAIILGKTNILQTLAGWESDNRVYGRTNNPWDLERTPGGSSGGESAIIAAGGSPLGLAGDLGGSIRIPAHFCGVHGLKPTSGRLTNTDFPPGLLSGGQETVIPQPGPIARSVSDLSLAMEVLVRSSLTTTADFAPPVPWRDPALVSVGKLRVGVYTESPYFPVSPAVERAVYEAATALENWGVAVEAFTPPDFEEGVRIFLGALSSSGGGDYKRLLGSEKPLPQVARVLQSMYTPKTVLNILSKILDARGESYLAHMMKSSGARDTAAYWNLVEARNAFRYDLARRMKAGGFDALLCPPFALPAPHHGTSGDLFPAGVYANIYNVLGNPAGVVSLTKVRPEEEIGTRAELTDQSNLTAAMVETGSTGLPIGVQVVGPHWREDIVLAVMLVLEQAFQHQPTYPVSKPSAFLSDSPVPMLVS